MPGETYRRIYSAVARIPSGRVATYGQIARIAGLPGRARLVGYALAALPAASRLPWHRVINARGAVSRRADGDGTAESPAETVQRLRLERERVRFDANGRVCLARFRWKG